MRTVTVGLRDRAYPIHIGEELLARADLFLPHLPQRKVSVVTNTTVASLYLEKFMRNAARCRRGNRPCRIAGRRGATRPG